MDERVVAPPQQRKQRGRSPTQRDVYQSPLNYAGTSCKDSPNDDDRSLPNYSPDADTSTTRISSSSSSPTRTILKKPSLKKATKSLSIPPVLRCQLVILVACILILSAIVTIMILYVVGYGDEIKFMYYESTDYLSSLLKQQNGALAFSKPLLLVRRQAFSFVTFIHMYAFQSGDSKKEDYTNYTIYDIDIPKECREKGVHQDDHSENNKQCRSIVTEEMMMAFQKDGVIAIRGLLSQELLNNLNQSSFDIVEEQLKKVGYRTSTGKQFFVNKMGPAFINDDDSGNYDNLVDELPSSGFRDVALSSLIPQVTAELLGMEYNPNTNTNPHESNTSNEEDNLRMLRDILLVKDADKFICGWHVDDLFFWPTTATSPGINAWIAIDDMSSTTGGNFAVSVGTHHVPWKEDVYKLTGATMTLPKEGYKDAHDFFQNRQGFGTCNIKNVAVELHKKLEERKRVYDLKAGDILFMTRWLFHRTIPYDREFVKEKKKQGELNKLLSRRYSIRYAPGSAELPRGYGTELSILWNQENQGRTLNAVAENDGPWYPKCWPFSLNDGEQTDMQMLMKEKLPIAEKRRKETVNEMKPFLKEIGQQQHEKQKTNAMNVMKERAKEL